MASSRREFIRTMGAGLASAGTAASVLARAGAGQEVGASAALLQADSRHVDPSPVGYDRLPLAWHQERARILKDRAGERGADGVLLTSDQNMVYYTGCFRRSGERSTWVLFRTDEADTVYWYSPGIDRDLVTTWWSTENDYYFGYPHAEGGFPNRGQVVQGATVDLWEWLLEGLARRGLAGRTIAVDRGLSPGERVTANRVLPGASFIDVADICLGMQVIKTPEELALLQRAYRYFDRIHAFARDYILERGTDLTDFELGQALQAYGINLLMNDVTMDGRPHTGVGIEVTSNYVRTGVASAYPHPNQFFHSRVERGQTVYVNTDIKLGGLGGECYRNYLIGPWTREQERLWEVVSETVQIMEEDCRTGALCSDIARRVHQHQVDAGMADFIYHRPGHGQGQFYVGHQAPFLALGDYTPLEAGMTFSVEPGLYDARAGIGINPSDNLRVTDDGGVRFSSVPFSKEWSFLEI